MSLRDGVRGSFLSHGDGSFGNEVRYQKNRPHGFSCQSGKCYLIDSIISHASSAVPCSTVKVTMQGISLSEALLSKKILK